MQGDLLYQLNKLTFAFFFFFQGNIDFFKEVFFFNVDRFYSLY